MSMKYKKDPKYPQLHDEAWLRREYEELQKSTIEVAEEIGCNPGTVQLQLKAFGIKARGRHSGKWKPKTCPTCGLSFIPGGPAAIFCSTRCRMGTALCEFCSTEFIKRAVMKDLTKRGGARDNRFCSLDCRYAALKSDARHRYESQGYVLIRRPDQEPTMSRAEKGGYVVMNVGRDAPNARKDGRVFEHRWVMEQHLGRPLEEWETVHHIDGDKTNNKIENLQLRSGRHGKGVVLACGDCGSQNIAYVEIAESA